MYALVLLAMFFAVNMLQTMDQTDAMEYSELRALFVQEKVQSFEVNNDEITLIVRADGDTMEKVVYQMANFAVFYEDTQVLINEQWQSGIIEEYDYVPAPWWTAYMPYVPYVFMFALVLGIWMVNVRRQNGGGGGPPGAGNFGRAKTKTLSEQDKDITFSDVAGAQEEKAELQEVVEFLREPQKFIELGARIPKGILLVGPPGTGKTLIAKAVAGEAGVQFLSISGSDFVEMFVGVGASRVRDLFAEAKKMAPSIVFIDEIDAVGRQRGAGLGGGHDEREQTLNQLLVEMDGFGSNQGVIVIAATNRQDILDPALLRPGRFDRQIFVGRPDIRGREEILKVHSRKKPLGDDVVLADIARSTAGFTGAELENLLNEAALLAARADGLFISQKNIHDAMLKVIAGPEKRSRVVVEHERKLTAYHEAGHAIVIQALETQDPVHQITIIPRGNAGGMTIHLPLEDRSYHSKKYLLEEIAVCLGGRVAEQLVLGDISTGASNDIQRATTVARAMVTKYGMSEKIGTVLYGDDHNEVFIGKSMSQSRGYSEEIAAEIDREVRQMIGDAYARCEDILSKHRSELDTIADYLLEHETMDAKEFQAVFEA